MSRPLRVLLVEDSEDDAELVLRALRAGGYAPETVRVQTETALHEALDAATWDVVISDHSLPAFSSIRALGAVRSRGLDVPFVIVSGTIGEETAVRAMKAGAHDYVMKHNLARLVPAVERELREAAARDERRRTTEALRRSEAQLRQSQKMEAIGRLAGGIAHDFNNLLTAIIGYSELLLMSLDPDDPNRRDVTEIKEAGGRAAALTRQLLSFSRQQVLEPQVLDLNAVIDQMLQMLRRLIGEDIELLVSLEPGLDRVELDPGHLSQVLMNLVVNARDAMPEGGRLTIETSHAEVDETFTRSHGGGAPGSFVLLAVSDSGLGMDAETQARLFEPFFTTKPAGQGTGLGLSTVYGIVQQSGGYITVYSEPGRGTTFRIYLPRASKAEPMPPPGPAAPRASSGAETILVAEDESAILSIMTKVLAGAGYHVLNAQDGRAALEIAREHPGRIDLLISDVVMPDMTGPDVAAEMARLHPEALVLFLSGYTDRAVLNNGVLRAGLEFLQKPFTPAALTQKVRQVLDGPRIAP